MSIKHNVAAKHGSSKPLTSSELRLLELRIKKKHRILASIPDALWDMCKLSIRQTLNNVFTALTDPYCILIKVFFSTNPVIVWMVVMSVEHINMWGLLRTTCQNRHKRIHDMFNIWRACFQNLLHPLLHVICSSGHTKKANYQHKIYCK